jgi:hypothetical protein
MTTYAETTFTCPACGNTDAYTALMSTNAFGSADLDLRPPPMKRHTMHTWVRRCQKCSCCFADGTQGNDLNLEKIDSEAYRQVGQDSNLPELAKDFIRYAIIRYGHDDQTEAWLNAAWVCDDEENEPEARKCRKKAYDILADNYESGRYQLYADYVGNPEKGLQALDLLRRSQHFELAQQKIDKITLAIADSSEPNKEIMKSIVCFQAEKIDAQDARLYTIRDAINYVKKED